MKTILSKVFKKGKIVAAICFGLVPFYSYSQTETIYLNNSSSPYYFTVPTDVQQVTVSLWGAGGGGGAGVTESPTNPYNYVGPGGGGGGAAQVVLDVNEGDVIKLIIPKGGEGASGIGFGGLSGEMGGYGSITLNNELVCSIEGASGGSTQTSIPGSGGKVDFFNGYEGLGFNGGNGSVALMNQIISGGGGGGAGIGAIGGNAVGSLAGLGGLNGETYGGGNGGGGLQLNGDGKIGLFPGGGGGGGRYYEYHTDAGYKRGGNGANGKARIDYTICPIPVKPTGIIGPNVICSDAEVTYSVTPVAGATSYVWTYPNGWTGTSTTNEITLTPSADLGNITVRAENSCGISDLTGINLYVEMINNSVSVTETELTANSIGDDYFDVFYQWYDCDAGQAIQGANSQSFVPEESGSYRVELSTTRYCEAVSDCIEFVVGSSTIKENVANSIVISPNPASDYIEVVGLSDNAKIEIVDILGKVVYQTEATTTTKIDVSKIQSGVVFLKIYDGNKSSKPLVKKLVVE